MLSTLQQRTLGGAGKRRTEARGEKFLIVILLVAWLCLATFTGKNHLLVATFRYPLEAEERRREHRYRAPTSEQSR